MRYTRLRCTKYSRMDTTDGWSRSSRTSISFMMRPRAVHARHSSHRMGRGRRITLHATCSPVARCVASFTLEKAPWPSVLPRW